MFNTLWFLSLAFAQNDSLSDNVIDALNGVMSVASSVQVEIGSYTASPDASTATDNNEDNSLVGSLGKLTGQLRKADGLIQAWSNTDDFTNQDFNSESFSDAMGELSSLFSTIIHDCESLNNTVNYILPNVVYAVEQVIVDISPRYQCTDLIEWDSLQSMLYTMDMMANSYSLNVRLPSTLPGTCSTYTWPGIASAQSPASTSSASNYNKYGEISTDGMNVTNTANHGASFDLSLWTLGLMFA